MPSRIERERALELLTRTVPAGACPMCQLAGREAPLAATSGALLVLNQFPIRWGHMLVVLRIMW